MILLNEKEHKRKILDYPKINSYLQNNINH